MLRVSVFKTMEDFSANSIPNRLSRLNAARSHGPVLALALNVFPPQITGTCSLSASLNPIRFPNKFHF